MPLMVIHIGGGMPLMPPYRETPLIGGQWNR